MVSAGELVVSIIGDMANLKRVIREVQSDVKGMSQELNKVGKDMSSAGSAMSTGITAPMVAVAAGIGLTTNASINFDTELRKTTTMLPGITKDAFNQMGQQSLALSRQFGEDTKDINEAWYNALSSNVPENNVFEFMKTSSKLAIGGMTDVNTAVDGLTSAMNAYGPSILSAQQASDIMFVDYKKGKVTIEELSKQLADVTPIAAANKVSFADLNSAIAAMTAQGTRVPVAMTQTKSLINELSQDTTQAGAAFKQLAGESFTEFMQKGGTLGGALQLLQSHVGETIPDLEAMNKAVKGFEDPASEMSQKFNDLTGKSFQQFVKQGGTVQQALKIMGIESGTTTKSVADFFSNIEGKTGALQLVGEGGKLYADTMNEMKNATGATDEAFKTMTEGMGHQKDLMTADWKAFVIETGQAFLPVFRDTIAPFVRETLIPALQKMVPVIVAIMQAFGSLSPIMQLIILGLTGLLAAAGPILIILGAMAGALGALSGLFAAGGLLASGGAVMAALGAAITALTGPIALIVAAVALLAIAWTRDWGGIQTYARMSWDFLITTCQTLYQRLQDSWTAITAAGSLLQTRLSVVWDVLSSVFSIAIGLISGLVSAWYNNAKSNFDKLVAAGNILLNAWKLIWTGIQTALSAASALVQSILNVLYSVAQGIFTRLITACQILLTGWQLNWTGIQTVINLAQVAVSSILNTLYSTAQSLFTRIVSALLSLYSEWQNNWTRIQNIISDAVAYIQNYLNNLYNSVTTSAVNIANKLLEPFWSIKDKILNYTQDWYDAGATILDNLYNGVLDGFNKVIGKAQEKLSELRGYLPFSPAKWGPFSRLPNWDVVFVDPMRVSINKMGENLEDGLNGVSRNITRITNSNYQQSSNITYQGSTISIGPNNLSGGVDIQRIFDEINRRVTLERQARGYYL